VRPYLRAQHDAGWTASTDGERVSTSDTLHAASRLPCGEEPHVFQSRYWFLIYETPSSRYVLCLRRLNTRWSVSRGAGAVSRCVRAAVWSAGACSRHTCIRAPIPIFYNIYIINFVHVHDARARTRVPSHPRSNKTVAPTGAGVLGLARSRTVAHGRARGRGEPGGGATLRDFYFYHCALRTAAGGAICMCYGYMLWRVCVCVGWGWVGGGGGITKDM